MKPIRALVLMLACHGLLTGPAKAEPVQLRPATNIYAGALPLQPGSYAIPCVTDWNGDGRKDLLVGYRTADKVALFLNGGTDANPIFTGFANLQAGGSDIYVQGESSCGAPSPWAGDFDNDGKRDLLVGSGLDGTVWFYRNTNTDAAPILAPGVRVQPLVVTVGSRATPFVYDWDEDGLPDLLCGSRSGTISFFRNTNSGSNPIFTNGVLLQVGGTALNLGSRSVARVFDWDSDGLKDLVGSSMTGVYWCRNTNSNARPVLQASISLQAPFAGSGLTNITSANTSSRMRLDLADWNDDGVIDLLLGKADGTVCWYEGYHFAFTQCALLPDGALALRWNSAPVLKYNLLAGVSLTNIQNLIVTNLASTGNRTGYTNPAGDGTHFFRVKVAP